MSAHDRHFDSSKFLSLLRRRGCRLGEPLTYSPCLESTNDAAKHALSAGAVTGSTFVSDEQTRGRGRRGRSWHADVGQSLLFSTVIQPRLAPEQLSCVTLCVGLGVRAALAQFISASLSIKWPNDVLCNDKKLAGVLVEGDVQHHPPKLVVGVGINVHTATFPPELAEIATSLRLLGGDVEREELLVEVLRGIEQRLDLLEKGEMFTITDELSAHDALSGKRVSVEGEQGFARGIDASGRLLLEVDGRVQKIGSGTVVIL